MISDGRQGKNGDRRNFLMKFSFIEAGKDLPVDRIFLILPFSGGIRGRRGYIRRMKKTLIILWGILMPWMASAQIHVPGNPASWKFVQKSPIPIARLKALPFEKRQAKVHIDAPQPLRAGYILPVNPALMAKGLWQQLPDGSYCWRLKISVSGATALNLYLENIHLGAEDRLFVYSNRNERLPGALSQLNNGSKMGTAYLRENELIIELDAPHKYDKLPFVITGVGNVTTFRDKSLKDFGDAGVCEVPVNCPEGESYQNQKNGVARILLREGNSLYWCSGSLINDTRNDEQPYFLTANHCGDAATAADYDQWVFYFNYESPDCSRPVTEPAIHSVSGARLLASTDYTTGSDFKLLLLKNKVPYTYKPYFNGWNRSGDISDSGVVIHHPQGDIKMVSTYKTPVRPVDYYGTVTDPNANFWEVRWAVTASGHGVTEGGSSGAPLFDSRGLIIGTLTGGDASCTTPNDPDYFGRFSKHWNSISTDSTRQLAYWLDKAGTGITQMPGFDPLSVLAVANFASDVNKTPIGGTIRFTDLSTGPVIGYHWTFEGGDPATYDAKNPPPVHYSQTGTFRVQLQVSSAGGVTTKTDSVYVLPVVYPNPVKDGRIHILLGSYTPSDIRVAVFDMLGRRINTFKPQFGNDNVILQLPHNQNGLYIIRLTNKQVTHSYKIINIHR